MEKELEKHPQIMLAGFILISQFIIKEQIVYQSRNTGKWGQTKLVEA
jgi:hypothetical protein